MRVWTAIGVLAALALAASSGCESVEQLNAPVPEPFPARLLSGEQLDRTFFRAHPWVVNVWAPG